MFFFSFSLFQDQLSNVDAAILLTLVDLFSKMHNAAVTAPKYRILFLLSESGVLLNFQGVKKWLETNLEENVAVQVKIYFFLTTKFSNSVNFVIFRFKSNIYLYRMLNSYCAWIQSVKRPSMRTICTCTSQNRQKKELT